MRCFFNKIGCLFVLFFICSYQLVGQRDTITMGLYVTNLFDFNIGDDCFTAEFWMWANYKNKEIAFETSPDVVGSKDAKFSSKIVSEDNGIMWLQQKCKSVIIHDWNVTKFPFDNQVLSLKLEEADSDTSAVVYKVDALNTKIDSQLVFDEWSIDSVRTYDGISTYNTTYGNPSLNGNSSYSFINVDIYIRRNSSWILFAKMTTGLYVSFLIALLVFMIHPSESESRIGLAVGGLFSAVGNKYIVESIVPTSTQNTIIDNLHNITFLSILIVVACVIYTSNLHARGYENKSFLMSKRVSLTIFITYLIFNIVLLLGAI